MLQYFRMEIPFQTMAVAVCSLLANLSVPPIALPPTDTLWSRNWVFCPHNEKNNAGATQDASVDTGVCSGSIPKSVWLDPRRRTEACAQVLGADVPSSVLTRVTPPVVMACLPVMRRVTMPTPSMGTDAALIVQT